MPNNRHFDLLAPLYDRLIGPPDPERLKRLLGLPLPEAWLLDLGGGTGRVAASLAPLVGRLVISDLSLPMLREAAGKGLLPAQARAECLPFAAGSFNRIIIVDAFHHFSDQPGAIREIVRLLCHGGQLVIEEPDIRRSGGKFIALGEKLLLMGSHFRDAEWLCDLLTWYSLHPRIVADKGTCWVSAEKI